MLLATNDLDMYIKGGYKEYEFMATLDEWTCPICSALDGKHFPISAARIGVNYPPLHEGCRCTTIAYDPEDEISFDDQHIDPNADYSMELDYKAVKKIFIEAMAAYSSKKKKRERKL